MRPRRSRLPAAAVAGFFFPRAVTRVTWHWIPVTTPAGHILLIRDGVPRETWPQLLDDYDRGYPWPYDRRRDPRPTTKYRRRSA